MIEASSEISSPIRLLPKLDVSIDASISREMRPEITDNHPDYRRSIKINGNSTKECIIATFNKIKESILDNGTIIIINYSKMRYEILLYNWEIFETFLIFFNIYIYIDGIVIEYDSESNTKTHQCVNTFIYNVYKSFNINILLRQNGIMKENNIYDILCQLFNENKNNIKILIQKASIGTFPDFDDFSHAELSLDELAFDDHDELVLEMNNLNSTVSKVDSDLEKFKKLINLMSLEGPFKFIQKPKYNFIELYLMSKLNTDINNELRLIYLMLNNISGNSCINIYLLCDILQDNYVYYLNFLPIRKKLYEIYFILKENLLMYQLSLPIDNILNSYKFFMINKSRSRSTLESRSRSTLESSSQSTLKSSSQSTLESSSQSTLESSSQSTLKSRSRSTLESRFFNDIPDEIFNYISEFLYEVV